MSGDLLEEATRALRENVHGACDDARAAEEEFAALLPRARRVRLIRPWGFSLAALLIGSSVWATSRGPLAPWFERVTTSEVESPRQSVVASHSGKKGSGVTKGVADTSSVTSGKSATSGVAPPAVEASLSPPSTTPNSVARRTPSVALPTGTEASASTPNVPEVAAIEAPAPAPTSSETLDVYEQAHELHFVRRDYARALVAWDRYLEVAPRGALALEARFHRAVCLTRIGSKEAARAALTPFARGDYGTYRREQAQKLLDEMGSAPR